MRTLRILPPATVATTREEAAPLVERLARRGGTLAIDTETTGLDLFRDRVLFWSIATEEERFCFPVSLLDTFDPLFRNPDISWCLANAKYDMHLLSNAGVELAGEVHDIIVMDAMADDTRPHGLKEQVRSAYDISWGDFKDLFLDPYVIGDILLKRPDLEEKQRKKEITEFKKKNVGDKLLYVWETAPHMVIDYASCDAFFTYMRWQQLSEDLAAEELAYEIAPEFKTLLDYFRVIEVPLTKVLFSMERTGVLIDQDQMKKMDVPMREGLARIRHELQEIAPVPNFNPRSTEHVRDALYSKNKFGFGVRKYTKDRRKKEPNPSTESTVVEALADQSKMGSRERRFCELLLEFRKLDKLHGTYVKSMPDQLGPDGRIHPTFNQAGTRTSRLSCSKPNLQNVPRPDEESDPYGIRSLFIASPGYDLVDGDYPQIEFRVAAVNSEEEAMLEAFRKGWDIHNANTANMFHVDYEKVSAAKKKSKDELTEEDRDLLHKRSAAKAAGLGVMYGLGKRRLARNIGVSMNEASDIQQLFFNTNPNLTYHIDYVVEVAHACNAAYTMFGRPRRLHAINNEVNRAMVAAEERQAFNHSVQGSAAELLKLAMLRIHHDKRFQELGGRLLLNIHDELLGEAPKDVSKDVADLKAELMGDPLRWGPIDLDYPVPCAPDFGIAHRWSEAK